MALITCPECTREISDQAATCPGCGVSIAGQASAGGNNSAPKRPVTIEETGKKYKKQMLLSAAVMCAGVVWARRRRARRAGVPDFLGANVVHRRTHRSLVESRVAGSQGYPPLERVVLLVPIPSTGLKQSHTHLGGAKLMGECKRPANPPCQVVAGVQL
jgi:hypothetical protein